MRDNDEDEDKHTEKVIRPNFSPSSIRSRLQQEQKGNGPPAKAEIGQAEILELDAGSPDKVDPLPRPGDDYKAYGRHGNKPDLTIHFVTKDYAYEGFSYGDFERVRLVPGDKPGSGHTLILRFNGSVVTEVKIEGKHLHSLYNLIGQHTLPWVWEHPSPKDFGDVNATIISRFTFREVED